MRNFIGFLLMALLLAACGKDKYTTAPQISLVKVSPNFASSDLPVQLRAAAPAITLKITDAEGDLGYLPGRDTSMVYVKNLSSQFLDSFPFPDLGSATGKNFSAEIVVNLYDCLDCVAPRPYLDTTYYEVYVTDFAGNKSNIVNTAGNPVYYQCL